MDTEALKLRITNTAVIGPALANQLLLQFDNIDPQKLELLGMMLEKAEIAAEDFGKQSKTYLEAITAIESALLIKVQAKANSIMAEFEEELQRLKL